MNKAPNSFSKRVRKQYKSSASGQEQNMGTEIRLLAGKGLSRGTAEMWAVSIPWNLEDGDGVGGECKSPKYGEAADLETRHQRGKITLVTDFLHTWHRVPVGLCARAA